jgi:hypothetical protein
MMPRILKLGKRAILKGPRTKEEHFFHTDKGAKGGYNRRMSPTRRPEKLELIFETQHRKCDILGPRKKTNEIWSVQIAVKWMGEIPI